MGVLLDLTPLVSRAPDSGNMLTNVSVDYADMQARDPEDRAPSVTIGVGRAILSNRISHFLNIKGPRYVHNDAYTKDPLLTIAPEA